MRPINDLLSRYVGQPALVIGGGPSALIDIPLLDGHGFKPGLVLSANLHGLYQGNFKVDYLVNVDKVHCSLRVNMEEWMRPYGVPIINAHTWADYRLVNWHFPGNSGITAIGVACTLGCWPVVAVGIDLFNSGRVYFHDETAPEKASRPKSSPPSHYAQQRVRQLKQWSGDYPIRSVSGPLATVFPSWRPDEVFTEPTPVKYRQTLLETTTKRYLALETFSYGSNDRVHKGEYLWLTDSEAKPFVGKHWLVARA